LFGISASQPGFNYVLVRTDIRIDIEGALAVGNLSDDDYDGILSSRGEKRHGDYAHQGLHSSTLSSAWIIGRTGGED
jgi:hypothetical protein